jgi:hypothetical protein
LVNESPVVLWFQSECRNNLEHQHQQLLWRNSERYFRKNAYFLLLSYSVNIAYCASICDHRIAYLQIAHDRAFLR